MESVTDEAKPASSAALVPELHKRVAELQQRVVVLSRERDEYKHLAELLKRELERLRDLQKTPREHVESQVAQLAFLEFAQELLARGGTSTPVEALVGALPKPPADSPKKKPRKHTPHGRAQLPEHLPVQTLVLRPAELPAGAKVVNEDVSWRLGFRRASFYRLKIIRPIFVVDKDQAVDGTESTAALHDGDVSALPDAVRSATPVNDAGDGEPTPSPPVEPTPVGVPPNAPADNAAAAGTAPASGSTAALNTVADCERATEGAAGVPESGSLASTTLVQALAPDEIIPRGLPTPNTLAHIIVSKFADKLPFNRQEGIVSREGIRITRGTMCNWTERAHGECKGVVAAMEREAREHAHCIMTDATGHLVQANEKCKKGHFWVLVADHDHVIFRYSARHSSDEPKAFLQGFRGTVLADASSVYDALFGLPTSPTEAGCNSHARRYLYKALASDRQRALAGIGLYNRLFELERAYPKDDPDERLRQRREQSAPVVAVLDQWRREQLEHPAVAEGTPLRKALNYIGNHWAALTRFLHDGKIPIHNNRSELELRRLVVGRANWLFVGSDETAAWTCTFVSLVASCQLHGLDPEAYLRDLFRVVVRWPKHRLLELSPNKWRLTRARLDPAELALPLGPLTIPPPVAAEQPAEESNADEVCRTPAAHDA